jgi:hypothetical protein
VDPNSAKRLGDNAGEVFSTHPARSEQSDLFDGMELKFWLRQGFSPAGRLPKRHKSRFAQDRSIG